MTVDRLTDEQRAMVEANLALVPWVVDRWYPAKVAGDRDERIADGFEGLIRAVQRFDPLRGFTFATYAPHWIRHAVQWGIGLREGINYRRAHGLMGGHAKGHYEAPISLDHGHAPDGDGALVDRLASGEDVAEAAVALAAGDSLARLLHAACKDALDHRVAEALLAGVGPTEIADDLGATFDVVRNKRQRLMSRMRHPATGLVQQQRGDR